MTDLLNSSQNDISANILYAMGVQKNARFKIGQARASKRSIVEYKRSSRVRKGRSAENIKIDRSAVTLAAQENVTDQTQARSVPLPRSPSSPNSSDSSPNSEPPSGVQAGKSTEHKRPRPEAHPTSNDVLCNLSSSAPPGCMRETSTSFFDTNRINIPTKGCSRQFLCIPCLLDEQRFQYLLSREAQYYPNNAFLYYVNPEVEDKVDATLRNEAVHNLRFMHNTFFNLSTETFCKAVNLIDRFVVKVKVKPKYMACVATAAYCVATKLCHSDKESELPDLDTLVRITRCGGNAADLIRMEEILASKLLHDLDGVCAFDFLKSFIDSMVETAIELDALVPESAPCDRCPFESVNLTIPHSTSGDRVCDGEVSPKSNLDSSEHKNFPNGRKALPSQLVKRLLTRLEITLCSLEAYRFRPACLALGILAQLNVRGLIPMANACGVDWADVVSCATLVEKLYENYYRDPLPCIRRPLIWTLSRRTLLRIGYSSPTPLDTITEDCEPAEEDEWLLPLLFEP